MFGTWTAPSLPRSEKWRRSCTFFLERRYHDFFPQCLQKGAARANVEVSVLVIMNKVFLEFSVDNSPKYPPLCISIFAGFAPRTGKRL